MHTKKGESATEMLELTECAWLVCVCTRNFPSYTRVCARHWVKNCPFLSLLVVVVIRGTGGVSSNNALLIAAGMELRRRSTKSYKFQ